MRTGRQCHAVGRRLASEAKRLAPKVAALQSSASGVRRVFGVPAIVNSTWPRKCHTRTPAPIYGHVLFIFGQCVHVTAGLANAVAAQEESNPSCEENEKFTGFRF